MEQPKTNRVTIFISMEPDSGLIDIKGPTDNAVLFLGLLEFAKAAVTARFNQPEKKEQPLVQPAMVIPNIGGKN